MTRFQRVSDVHLYDTVSGVVICKKNGTLQEQKIWLDAKICQYCKPNEVKDCRE